MLVAALFLILFGLGSCLNAVPLSALLQLNENTILRGRAHTKRYSTMGLQGVDNAENTIAAVMLISESILSPHDPIIQNLRCSLVEVYINVGLTTPIHLHIFVHEASIPHLPPWLYTDFPALRVHPIDPESWKLPSNIPHYDDEAQRAAHLTAQWKLTYPFDFAQALGYQYVMLLDYDTYFVSKVNLSIIERFNAEGQVFAFRGERYAASPAQSSGLYELAKYWQASRNALTPPGTLTDHIVSEDLGDGYTEAVWDREGYWASPVVVRLEFWFHPAVQDFVNLVLTSSGDLLSLWREYGVLNMVRLLFAQTEQVHLFPQTALVQDLISNTRIFQLLQCAVPAAPSDGTEPALSADHAEGSQNDKDAPSEAAVRQEETGMFRNEETGKAIRRVEVLITTQSMGVKSLAMADAHKELFLLGWRFNAASCGEDTSVLNNYEGYVTEAEESFMRANLWWHKNRVDEKLDRMLAEGRQPMESGVSADGVLGAPADVCRARLRHQLVLYVDFYLSYGFYGRKMKDYYNGLMDRALQIFDALFG